MRLHLERLHTEDFGNHKKNCGTLAKLLLNVLEDNYQHCSICKKILEECSKNPRRMEHHFSYEKDHIKRENFPKNTADQYEQLPTLAANSKLKQDEKKSSFYYIFSVIKLM